MEPTEIKDGEQMIKPEEPIRDPNLKGVVGIMNLGNTCYSNSTIQLLRACPEWTVYCGTKDFTSLPERANYKRILLAYQDILKALWSTYKPAYIRPNGFMAEVRKAVQGTIYEMFGVPIPNDSHEYLVYLLDNFHEATKVETQYQELPLGENTSPTEKMRIMAKNGWNRFVSKNDSEIVRIFFGMMRKTVQCSNCENNSYQWEVFNSLKIPCEGESFKDWIKNEVKEGEIEGYHCEKCNGRHLAKIYTHLWKLPQNLFITLRRFNFDGRKINIQCPYGGESIMFSDYFATEADDESRYWVYELRGISDHHGSTMGGHYTAQFKHPISGGWWLFDDETSYKIEKPQFSSSNYILLFRKLNQGEYALAA